MLTPREIVFRLNGGGDVTALGAVLRPVAVVVVPAVGVVPVVGVVGVAVVVELGDTSGEKIAPTPYSDRLRPYCLVRERSTSRISTSKTISARGLSFCSMTFSRICTTFAAARTVIVFAVLLGTIAGCTLMPGSRMIVLSICVSSVASACER